MNVETLVTLHKLLETYESLPPATSTDRRREFAEEDFRDAVHIYIPELVHSAYNRMVRRG